MGDIMNERMLGYFDPEREIRLYQLPLNADELEAYQVAADVEAHDGVSLSVLAQGTDKEALQTAADTHRAYAKSVTEYYDTLGEAASGDHYISYPRPGEYAERAERCLAAGGALVELTANTMTELRSLVGAAYADLRQQQVEHMAR